MRRQLVVVIVLALVLALTASILYAQDGSGTPDNGSQDLIQDRTTLFSMYGGTIVATAALGILNYLGLASKMVRFLVVFAISIVISVGFSWFVNPDPDLGARLLITVANVIMMTASTLGINEVGARAGNVGGVAVASATTQARLFKSLVA